jgi:hypothetical protein
MTLRGGRDAELGMCTAASAGAVPSVVRNDLRFIASDGVESTDHILPDGAQATAGATATRMAQLFVRRRGPNMVFAQHIANNEWPTTVTRALDLLHRHAIALGNCANDQLDRSELGSAN